MNQGLASLPVKHFRNGGFGISMADPEAPGPAISGFGLFAPSMNVATPFGNFNVTPMDMASLAVPAVAPLNTAINAINALAAMNTSQSPAPVTSVEGQIAQTVAQEATDAVDAAEGLAAMNAANAQAQAAESAATADAAATAAMAEAVSDSVAAADAADAAAAAAAAGDAGAGGGGGDGGGVGGADGGGDGAAGGDGGGDGGGGAAGGGGGGGDGGGGGGGERAGGIIAMRHRYAQGGMPDVARHVQSQGRGDDKVLVHMTPQEVQGLQYLAMRHGGSLTINPRTGLVEAGFLSSILPMVAGAALTIGSGGVINPYMSAAIVGGVTGLASGSLKKGLMAGLGAFGGAGLGTGLSAAGAATAPAVTGTQAGLTTVGETAAADIASRADLLGIAPGVGPGIATPPAAGMVPGMSATNAAQYFGAGAPGAETFAGIAPPPTTAADIAARANAMGIAPGVGPGIAPPPPAPPTFGQNFQQAGRGFSNIFDFQNQAGTEARQAFLGTAADEKTGTKATGVGGVPGLLKSAGAAAAPMIAEMAGPDQSVGGGKEQAYVRPFKYTAGRQDVPYRTGARGESTAEQLYFSPQYTPMGVFRPGEEPTYGSYAMGGGINMGGRIDPDYNENIDRNAAFSDDFYGGGLTALAAGGKPKEPRFLTGNGDGMSDSIPATINDVQPARLADGEFVIPADVVSHLGNGSSKAGAAKLHSMMKRIRQARTGKKRQAPEVKAERYMPA